MIDKNKEYTTRDGRKVRIYAVESQNNWPVHGAVLSHDGNEWTSECWKSDGSYSMGSSGWDLIEARKPIKMKKYVSVWHNERKDGYTIGSIYESREQLSQTLLGFETKNLVAFIPVTIEGFEGDGL